MTKKKSSLIIHDDSTNEGAFDKSKPGQKLVHSSYHITINTNKVLRKNNDERQKFIDVISEVFDEENIKENYIKFYDEDNKIYQNLYHEAIFENSPKMHRLHTHVLIDIGHYKTLSGIDYDKIKKDINTKLGYTVYFHSKFLKHMFSSLKEYVNKANIYDDFKKLENPEPIENLVGNESDDEINGEDDENEEDIDDEPYNKKKFENTIISQILKVDEEQRTEIMDKAINKYSFDFQNQNYEIHPIYNKIMKLNKKNKVKPTDENNNELLKLKLQILQEIGGYKNATEIKKAIKKF